MKMTLLGSGVRAPFVLRGLAAGQDDLGLDEVVLHDTDTERLTLMTALGRTPVRRMGCPVHGARRARPARGDRRRTVRLLGDPARAGGARAPSTRRCR